MRADERAGAAVIQTHTGEAHMVQPLLRGCEMILLLQLLDGRIIECPHALIGAHGYAGCEQAARRKSRDVAAKFGCKHGKTPGLDQTFIIRLKARMDSFGYPAPIHVTIARLGATHE